jgi:hypothetical protein
MKESIFLSTQKTIKIAEDHE